MIHSMRVEATKSVLVFSSMLLLFSLFTPIIKIPQGFFFLSIVICYFLFKFKLSLYGFSNRWIVLLIFWMLFAPLLSSGHPIFNVSDAQRLFQQIVGMMLGVSTFYIFRFYKKNTIKKQYLLFFLMFLFGLVFVNNKGGAPIISDAILRMLVGIIGSYLIMIFWRKWYISLAISMGLFISSLILFNSKAFACVFMVSFMFSQVACLYHQGEKTIVIFIKISVASMLLAGLFSGILLWLHPDRFNDIYNWQSSISTVARLSVLASALRAILDNPMFGIGPVGFNSLDAYALYYHDSGLLQALIDQGLTRTQAYSGVEVGYSSGTHQMYFDLAVSYGLPMLFFILCLLLRSGLSILRRWKPFVAAVWVTIVVSGLEWQYSSTSYGMALLMFAICAGNNDYKLSRKFCLYRRALKV